MGTQALGRCRGAQSDTRILLRHVSRHETLVYLSRTGDMGAIGALEEVAEILAGKAGTIVTPSGRWPLDNGVGFTRSG